MKVPQMRPWVGEEEHAAMRSCFADGWITEGPRCKEFLEALLALTGARHGVFAPNGTLALYLAMRAIGIGPGDEVLVPDLTFIATATAVEMTGATPVFVDVSRDHHMIDLASCERWRTKKTRALAPVHLWGAVAEMDQVLAYARQHRLAIIEDAAQAIDVRYRGKHAGTFGEVGTFSFFADKTITTAEGGMVVTDDPDVHRRLLLLRNQGRLDRGAFWHPEIGYNFRITDMQAAVGLVQLEKLAEIKRRKAVIAQWYREGLHDLEQVVFFVAPPGSEWIPFRMPLLCDRLDELIASLVQHEIEPRRWFHPLHAQPCFARFTAAQLQGADPAREFAHASDAALRGLCLPTFPELTEGQVDYVCATIRRFYGAA